MGEKIKALTAFIVERFLQAGRDLNESSQALCGNGSRLLSLSGGNRWKLVNAKDSLPVTDVTGSACLFEGK